MDLARRLAEEYARPATVDAVMVAGSASRGQDDRYSDLKIGVFWSGDPAEAERAKAIERAGADLHFLYPRDGLFWSDAAFAGCDAHDTEKSGVPVDVCHMRTADVQRLVDTLEADPTGDDGTVNIFAGLDDGVPVAGVALLQRWQDAARRYPDPLARAVVREHGQIEFAWRWRMLVDRGAPATPVLSHFWDVQRDVLSMLLAVNRRYPVGYKFLDAVIDRCVIAPPRLGERIRSIASLTPAEAAEDLGRLVHGTYDLVSERIPGMENEVAQWRQWFDYSPSFWDTPPPTSLR